MKERNEHFHFLEKPFHIAVELAACGKNIFMQSTSLEFSYRVALDARTSSKGQKVF